MMKTILTSMILLATSLPAMSQFPSWKIKPNNDTLHIMEGSSIIRGDRKGKTTLWNLEGKELYSTDDRLNKFYDGRATVINKEAWEIIGFIDTDGKFISIPHIGVVYNHPHFENGFLIGKRKGKFTMFSKDGKEQPLPDLMNVYPFSNGYAVYMAYENPEKQKKPFYNYIKADGTPLERFILKENDKPKPIEPKNIRFLSAVDKDGRGLAIVKNKLYWFDAADESLIPVLMGDETEKKRHLNLIEDKSLDFTAISDANLKFQAKYGKEQLEDYEFDNRLRLLKGGKPNNARKESAGNQLADRKTILDDYVERGVYGLIYDGNDSLPAQFEQIGLKYDNNAFVKSKGKWGVLQLAPDMEFDIKLNDGEPIAFRHQKFATKLHINLPCSIPSKGIRTDIADIPGFNIDLASKENRDTRTGNYIIYNCVLSVPNSLTDSVEVITYGPLSLIYDNVRLHPITVKATGHYIAPYSIETTNKELIVDQNKTAFDITVNVDKGEEEEDFPYSLGVQSDAVMARIEKVSDNNYKCFLDYVEEGLSDLDLILTENGCPTRIFPMELASAKKGRATVGLKKTVTPQANDSTANAQNSDRPDGKVEAAAKKNQRVAAVLQKAPLFVKFSDGYMAAEVTAQDPCLNSGPRESYPAPNYEIDNIGQQEIPAPYTGQLIKVKDEGEWYLKHPSFPASQKPQPEYISKNSVRPLRSTPFDLKEISEPITYVTSHEIFDEANNKGQYLDEVIVFPNGVCIEYSAGKTGSLIKYGQIVDGRPAIEWRYRIQTTDGGEAPDGSKTKVAIDNSNSMHRLRLTVAPQDRKSVMEGKTEMKYFDLAAIGADKWTDTLKDYLLSADAKYDKHETTEYECDVVTKDMLEKNYIRVNK